MMFIKQFFQSVKLFMGQIPASLDGYKTVPVNVVLGRESFDGNLELGHAGGGLIVRSRIITIVHGKQKFALLYHFSGFQSGVDGDDPT